MEKSISQCVGDLAISVFRSSRLFRAVYLFAQVVNLFQQLVAALLSQEFADELFISRLVIMQKSRLEAFFSARFRHVNFSPFVISAGDVHRCRERHRARDKILYLSRPPRAPNEVLGQLERIFGTAAGMSTDKVRNEIDLFARPAA